MNPNRVALLALIFALAAQGTAPAQPASPAAPPATKGPGEITVQGQATGGFAPLSGSKDFISPMGEPFRSTDSLSGAEHWFAQADTNHNGRLSQAEFRADAARFFTLLDTDHDGEIGPIEIQHYEQDIAPEIEVVNTYGDLSKATTDSDGKLQLPPYPTRLGAGRFSYLAMPEPVIAADANLDRGITAKEFQDAADKRLKMLDFNGDGVITRDELPKLASPHSDR
jgi:Ca2+-binding EF-hand superfamily protein